MYPEGYRANGYARTSSLRVKASPSAMTGRGVTNRELSGMTTLTIFDDCDSYRIGIPARTISLTIHFANIEIIGRKTGCPGKFRIVRIILSIIKII